MNRVPGAVRGMVVLTVMAVSLDGRAQTLDANEILRKVDQRVNSFEDQEMSIKMTVYDTDGSSKSYSFTVQQKGDSKRLVRFLSGEIKGMAVLSVDPTRTYVYLPGYKRVRPVAAHNMNQSVAGSDFSNEDMAAVSWPKLYTPLIEKEDADYWHLKLTPKSKDSSYSRLIMKVGKKDFLQWSIEYYDSKGVMVKHFTADKPKKFGTLDFDWHSLIEMKDPRNGHRTTLEIQELKVNQGLDDGLFTPRNLQWSR